MNIRPARASDAEAMLGIYAPVVRSTAISFELEPPTLQEFQGRIARNSERWAWLVAEGDGGQVLGYAYGSQHRERAAYQWTCEVSAYIAPQARGRGVGRALYEALFPVLAARGYHGALAVVTLPNAASVGLHEAVGFKPVGVVPHSGFKHGRWHDIAWFHRFLGEGDAPPAGPPG